MRRARQCGLQAQNLRSMSRRCDNSWRKSRAFARGMPPRTLGWALGREIPPRLTLGWLPLRVRPSEVARLRLSLLIRIRLPTRTRSTPCLGRTEASPATPVSHNTTQLVLFTTRTYTIVTRMSNSLTINMPATCTNTRNARCVISSFSCCNRRKVELVRSSCLCCSQLRRRRGRKPKR